MPPTDAEGYLRQLPAFAVLDRLPAAMLGVGQLGDITYANPACADLLGYADGRAVTQLQLPDVMTGHQARSPTDCLNILRTATAPVEWNHHQDYVIVSTSLLLRDTDTLLLVGITDVTALLWETKRNAEAKRSTEIHGQSRRTEGHGPARRTDRR
jgi:PAS domain-containing protein